MSTNTLPAVITPLPHRDVTPPLIEQAGSGARLAWDEWFSAEMRNPHTRRAYGHAVRQFLSWCEGRSLPLREVTPGAVGDYYNALRVSVPTKNQHLSALRCFFDRLVIRHAVLLNPAASVRGERYSLSEGKTPEITVEQERKLLKSIRGCDLAALRDRAIAAILIYTAARVGAVATLSVGSFAHDGNQWCLRFFEKGGKVREIPVRRDLRGYLSAYVEAGGLCSAPADNPLFRRITRNASTLKPDAMTGNDIRRMLKQRMARIHLPEELSPHSFRVAAITDLLEQGVPLEDVQNLVGHADPRTTRLYDRRQKKIMLSVVQKISV
jgi:integrase/recombinase XerD